MKENEVLDDGFSSFGVSHLVSLKGYLVELRAALSFIF